MNQKRSIFKASKFYLPYMSNSRAEYIYMMFAFMVKHSTSLISPILLKIIIDDFIPAKNLKMIYACVLVVLIAGIVNFFLHRSFAKKLARISKEASRRLRNKLIHKLQILSFQFHQKFGGGAQFSKIMIDVEKTERFGKIILEGGLGALYTFFFSFFVLLSVNPWLLLLYSLIIPMYLLVYRFFHGRFSKYQKEARVTNEELSKTVSQFIQTNMLSRVHGEEEHEKKKVDAKNSDLIHRYVNIQKQNASFSVSIFVLAELMLILIAAISAHAIIEGAMAIGALVLFVQYIRQMINAVTMIMHQIPEINEFTESVYSINEILQEKDEEINEGKFIVKKTDGEVRFKDASFTYNDPKHPVLKDINLDIKKGTSVALVGASGSGKTTLINLVLGLLRAQKGQVMIDGHNINELDMRSLRKYVGVVTQQAILFRGSIAENIAYGKDEFDLEEVREAARKANALEFIEATPNGFLTQVGESGDSLSGGQKQRISIARAIFRKPSMLVLDEATSALDPVAEKEVQKGINSIMGNQTTFVIAHRLSTIFRCDRILVFEKGKIIEQGSHNELIEKKGKYATLLLAQMGIDPKQLASLKI